MDALGAAPSEDTPSSSGITTWSTAGSYKIAGSAPRTSNWPDLEDAQPLTIPPFLSAAQGCGEAMWRAPGRPSGQAEGWGPGPARGGHGPQRLPHLGHGPHPRRGDGGTLHHGLEQGQRGRRGLRQARPPLPAGAGPDRGGPGPHRGTRGQEAGSICHRPRGPRGVRHDQRGPLQGGLPAPVARPAQDGAAPEVSHPTGPGLPGGAHPALASASRAAR